MKTYWKKPTPLCLAAALAAGVAPAGHAFAEFARGEFQLATTAATSYDSRVQGSRSGGDDFIYTLHPELIYRREAAEIKVDAAAGVLFNRYDKFTQFDSEDADTHIGLTLPKDVAGTRASGQFRAAYTESTDLDYDVNQRIRSKNLNSRLETLLPVGLKTSFSLTGVLTHNERQTFGTLETHEFGGGFNYSNFLDGTDLSLRYRRLEADSSGQSSATRLNQDSDSYSIALGRPIYANIHGSISYGYRILQRAASETRNGQTRSEGSTFSASLDGPFLPVSQFPKLESSLSVSYQDADTPGVNDTGSKRVVGKMSLGWDARTTTHVLVSAHRGLELTTDNRTVITTGAAAQLEQTIGHFVQFRAGSGYERREFREVTRDDDVITAFAGADYRATRSWVTGFDYRYRVADSNERFADYERHLIRLFATYTF